MAIHLFTDFGINDFYVGQVKCALLRHAPAAPVIDLLHQAPLYNSLASAHLLFALSEHLAAASVVFAVVDPGVGGSRDAVVVYADGKYFVGPDNGLLSIVAARAREAQIYRIRWRPEALSSSFHGRDLFAPVAAWLATNTLPSGALEPLSKLAIEFENTDLGQIIYIDHYGNAITGIRARSVARGVGYSCRGVEMAYARTFSDAENGRAFWYENSLGLVELALNRASAAETYGFAVGDAVELSKLG